MGLVLQEAMENGVIGPPLQKPAILQDTIVSEPVPPTNSDMSGDKCEGMSTTGGGDAEVFEDFGFSVCAAPLRYLHPLISED